MINLLERPAVMLTPTGEDIVSSWMTRHDGTTLALLSEAFTRHPGRTIVLRVADRTFTGPVHGVIAQLMG